MQKSYDFVVPGLDVLIGDPSIIDPWPDSRQYAKVFYIPEEYVNRIIDFYHEASGRGDACRELTARFGIILNSINYRNTDSYELANHTVIKFITPDKYSFYLDRYSKNESSKRQAVATALYLRQQKDTAGSSAIMTGSSQLATLAALNKVEVMHLNPEVYTGRRKIYLAAEQAGIWYSNHKITDSDWKDMLPDQSPLRPNEFVEFVVDNFGQVDHSFRNIGRYDADLGALVPLKHFCFKDSVFSKIYPRTPGQAMLLEALLAPPEEIPLVIASGTFGTGKTFLATAAGYYGVTRGSEYERVFICPRDGSLGRDIGAIPGTATEKTLVKAKPIADNLREIMRITGSVNHKSKFDSDSSLLSEKRTCIDRQIADVLDHYFEYEPIVFMGGRSISNSFIIYDEFQDMERYQAKALLTRIGNQSKIVVSGDPTQITNPHLDFSSNGLSYSASKLAGKPEAAIITLGQDEIVRSSAALAIANYFS